MSENPRAGALPGPRPAQGISAAWAAVVVGTALGLRIVIALTLECFPDEVLYHWIGMRAPLNFGPHPPGTPFLARLGTGLLGMNEFGVRLFPVLLGALVLLPLYWLARSMVGAASARRVMVLFASVPLYLAFGAIVTPDGPQLFFWVLLLWLTWNGLESGRLGWWIGAGVVLGLGLFVKYVLVLYVPSLLLCLLLSPDWRVRLRSAGPWALLATAGVVFLPFTLWSEWSAGWPSVRYHLGDRQLYLFPSAAQAAQYHAVHLGIVSPLTYAACVAAMAWAGVAGWRTRSRSLLFAFSFAAPTWLFFGAIAVVTKRQLSREQWDAMAYVPALIAAVMMVDAWTAAGAVGWRRMLCRCVAWAPAVAWIMIGVFLVEGYAGLVSRLLDEPPLFRTTLGWRELGAAADRQLNQLPAGNRRFVLGESFTVSMEYAFYGKGTTRIYAFDDFRLKRYGLTRLCELTGMTQHWLENERGGDAVFIAEELPARWKKEDPTKRHDKLGRTFAQFEQAEVVEVKHCGRVVKVFRLYRCIGAKGPPA